MVLPVKLSATFELLSDQDEVVENTGEDRFKASTSLSSARPNNCDISILRMACVLGENVLKVCAYDKNRLSMWSGFVSVDEVRTHT